MKKASFVMAVLTTLVLTACGEKAAEQPAEPAKADTATTEQVAKEAEAAAQNVTAESSNAQEATANTAEASADSKGDNANANKDTAEARAGEDQQY